MVLRIESMTWPDLAQLGTCGSSSVDAAAVAARAKEKAQYVDSDGLYGVGTGGTCDTSSTDDPVRDQQQPQQLEKQSSPTGPGQAQSPDLTYSRTDVFKNVREAMAAAMEKKETRSGSTTNHANEVHPTDSSSSSAEQHPHTGPSPQPQDSPLHHMWERAGNFVGPQFQTSLEEGKQMFQQRWTALFQNEACASVVPCNSPVRSTRRPMSSTSPQPPQEQPGAYPIPHHESPTPQQQQQQQQDHLTGPPASQPPPPAVDDTIGGKENTLMATVAALQTKAAAVAMAAAAAAALDQEPLPKQENEPTTIPTPDNNKVTTREIGPSPTSEDSPPLSTTAQIEVSSDHQVRVIEPVQLPPPSPLHNSNPAPPPKSPSSSSRKSKRAPLSMLEVKTEDAVELERSISELTMKSSYGGGESLARIPDNRRMAYYAVGKHHRQSGRGGNRRCYFSGKLILGGAPFYAGAVQQGLRTLVVFCLPSAIGLPAKEAAAAHKLQQQHQQKSLHRPGTPLSTASSRKNVLSGTTTPPQLTASLLREHSKGGGCDQSVANSSRGGGRGTPGLPPAFGLEKRPSMVSRSKRKISNSDGHSIASKSMSRLSSLDDLSLSIDGDLDPNWGLDRDFLLKVLPEPDASILKQIAVLYPEQFETLPIQVRDAARWKLFVKFCFFSGLPIAEGEMHYKVRDEIAEIVYGEEIVLSHDVMEAVNGDVSAEILQLPNTKAFRYLRKHYGQQCSKLDERVFRRAAWERVAPEI